MDGHVSHAATVMILQEARAELDRVLGIPLPLWDGLRIVVGGLAVEYAEEMYFPQPAEVCCGIISLGRTSFVLGQTVRQNGRIAAYANTALVVSGDCGPTPLPERMRLIYEGVMIA